MIRRLLDGDISGMKALFLPVEVKAHFELNQPYHITVSFYSDCKDVQKTEDVLGKAVYLKISQSAQKNYYWHGIVSSITKIYAQKVGDYYPYRITIEPSLIFLKYFEGCRSFVNKSVLTIFNKICSENYVSPLNLNHLSEGTYPILPYVVQYQETQFDFFSRLAEAHGLGYWFQFTQSSHSTVFADNGDSYQNIGELIWGSVPAAGQMHAYQFQRKPYSGGFRVSYFDYKHANHIIRCEAQSKYTLPGTVEKQLNDVDPIPYAVRDSVKDSIKSFQRDVDLRLRAEEVTNETVFAEGQHLGLLPGMSFHNKQLPTASGQSTFYVASADYHLVDYSEMPADPERREKNELVEMKITAHPIVFPYAPKRRTPIPKEGSVSRAKVVGPKNKEVYTDKKYGAVKLKFVWDQTATDEEAMQAPWFRVIQPQAGKKSGFQFIPRIGQEVICQFEHGFLENPLVLAACLNSCHSPVFQTNGEIDPLKSGLQTHTLLSDDPTRGHVLQFDDTAGQEQFSISSPGDLVEEVVGQKTTIVKGDQTFVVEHGDLTTEVKDGKLWLKADDYIELQVGQSKIRLEPDQVIMQAETIEFSGGGGSGSAAAVNTAAAATAMSRQLHWRQYLLSATAATAEGGSTQQASPTTEARSAHSPNTGAHRQPKKSDSKTNNPHADSKTTEQDKQKNPVEKLQTICVDPVWRKFVPEKKFDETPTLCRLPNALQQRIFDDIIAQYQVDDIDQYKALKVPTDFTHWTRLVKDKSLINEAKQTLQLSRQYPLRAGWIYVYAQCSGGPGDQPFKKMRLFKEYKVTHEGSVNFFHEVDLSEQAGLDERDCGGMSHSIELPYQFVKDDQPDGLFKVQVVFSAEQLSWPRVHLFGGMDQTDPRLKTIKNPNQQKLIQQVQAKPVKDDIRNKRFGQLLSAKDLKNIYDAQYNEEPPFILPTADTEEAEQWVAQSLYYIEQDQAIPYLLLDDPIGMVMQSNQQYMLLQQKLLAIVNELMNDSKMQTALLAYQFFYNLRADGIMAAVDGVGIGPNALFLEKSKIYNTIISTQNDLDIDKFHMALKAAERQVIKQLMQSAQQTTIDILMSQPEGDWGNSVDEAIVDSFAQDTGKYKEAHIKYFGLWQFACVEVNAIDLGLEGDALPVDSLMANCSDSLGRPIIPPDGDPLNATERGLYPAMNIDGYTEVLYKRQGFDVVEIAKQYGPKYKEIGAAKPTITIKSRQPIALPVGYVYLKKLFSGELAISVCVLPDAQSSQQLSAGIQQQNYLLAQGHYSAAALHQAQQLLQEELLKASNQQSAEVDEKTKEFAKKQADKGLEKSNVFIDGLISQINAIFSSKDHATIHKIKTTVCTVICDWHGLSRDSIGVGQPSDGVLLSLAVHAEGEVLYNNKIKKQGEFARSLNKSSVYKVMHEPGKYYDSYAEAEKAVSQQRTQVKAKLIAELGDAKANLKSKGIFIKRGLLASKLPLSAGLAWLAWADVEEAYRALQQEPDFHTITALGLSIVSGLSGVRELVCSYAKCLGIEEQVEKFTGGALIKTLEKERFFMATTSIAEVFGLVGSLYGAITSTVAWVKSMGQNNPAITTSNFLGMLSNDLQLGVVVGKVAKKVVKKKGEEAGGEFFEKQAGNVAVKHFEETIREKVISETTEKTAMITCCEAIADIIPIIDVIFWAMTIFQIGSFIFSLFKDNQYQKWAKKSDFADKKYPKKFKSTDEAYVSLLSLISSPKATVVPTADKSQYRLLANASLSNKAELRLRAYLTTEKKIKDVSTIVTMFEGKATWHEEFWPLQPIPITPQPIYLTESMQFSGLTDVIDKPIKQIAKTYSYLGHKDTLLSIPSDAYNAMSESEQFSTMLQRSKRLVEEAKQVLYAACQLRLDNNHHSFYLPNTTVDADIEKQMTKVEDFIFKHGYSCSMRDNGKIQLSAEESEQVSRQIAQCIHASHFEDRELVLVDPRNGWYQSEGTLLCF